jgi:hypothetical protein
VMVAMICVIIAMSGGLIGVFSHVAK